MIGSVHVPNAVLQGLADGGGGTAAARFLVRSQHAKNLMLLRLVVAAASAYRHRQSAELAASYDLLAAIQDRHPNTIAQVVSHPPVGAWAVRVVEQIRSGTAVDSSYLAGLAASAAIMARFECVTKVPVRRGRLFLPYLGQARIGDPLQAAVAAVRSRSDGAEIVTSNDALRMPADPRSDDNRWRGIRRLDAGASGVSLLLDDLDPFRLPGSPVTGRLEPDDLTRWRVCLARTWELLAAHHPEVIAEIAAVITVLVPLAGHRKSEASATHRHCFGAIGSSLPSDARALGAALAHERQHTKLNALLDLVSLVEDPGSRLWYAPWRDDPRPLGALLQGAYAHLGVAAFWRRQRLVDRGELARQSHTRFVRWRDSTGQVIATLRASGALTRLGDRFVDGMRSTIESWREEWVPADVVRQTRAEAIRHRTAWERRHGTSPQRG